MAGPTDRKFTTVPVRPELRNELRAMKRGDDSYTDVIRRLIEGNPGSESDPRV